MGNPYYGDYGVNLPNMFPAPGEALQNEIERRRKERARQYEIDYRNAKDKEASDWKKLNLVRELTDLSAHQTGDDVTNAIGTRKMDEIYQKYTAAASTMSPAELQTNIQREMTSIISGMDSAKQEFSQADEQAKILKTKFPSLDINKLLKDYRAEILSRRITPNGDFANPTTVGLSAFDVTDPENLSRYVSGNKSLSEAIINPKGTKEAAIYTGDRMAHTQWKAKVPFFLSPNFDETKNVNGEFYTGPDRPKLIVRGTALPSSAIQPVNGQPFMVMDKDVYDKFSEDQGSHMELIAATRNRYPNYDKMSQQEKELAKRNVLYGLVNSLNTTDFVPENLTHAPVSYNRTTVKVGSGDTKINDLFGRITKAVEESEAQNRPYVPMNSLPLDAQNAIIDMANKTQKIDKDEYQSRFDQKNLILKRDDNGNIAVFDISNTPLDENAPGGEEMKYVGGLPEIGVNLKVQPNARAKVKAVEKANEGKGNSIKDKWSQYKVNK